MESQTAYQEGFNEKEGVRSTLKFHEDGRDANVSSENPSTPRILNAVPNVHYYFDSILAQCGWKSTEL